MDTLKKPPNTHWVYMCIQDTDGTRATQENVQWGKLGLQG